MRDVSWLDKKLVAYQEKLLIEFTIVNCTVEYGVFITDVS